jgi:hypothetical protein
MNFSIHIQYSLRHPALKSPDGLDSLRIEMPRGLRQLGAAYAKEFPRKKFGKANQVEQGLKQQDIGLFIASPHPDNVGNVCLFYY